MMSAEERQPLNPPPLQSPGLLGRIVAFAVSAALIVLAFMFSLVALAVVGIGGVLLGGWLWWKTRQLRKQMREQGFAVRAESDQGQIIEGEAFRTDEPPFTRQRLH